MQKSSIFQGGFAEKGLKMKRDFKKEDELTFKECQDIIVEHSGMDDADAIVYVQHCIDEDELTKYDCLSVKGFMQAHYRFEMEYVEGNLIIPLEVYADYVMEAADILNGCGDEPNVIHERGCDLAEYKVAIASKFVSVEETYR
jgi:hypothetical protein